MLIVTGTLAYDYLMAFPGQFHDHILPDQLDKINLSFIMHSFTRRRGGTAGNVSYSLGLLTTPHILYSIAGKDFEEYKAAFEALRIPLQHVQLDLDTYTATGFAMTDNTANQIWGYYYGAAEGIKDLSLQGVATSEDLVLIGPSGAPGSMNFVRQCIEMDIPYMFDPGFILTQVTDEELSQGVQHARFLIGNEYEMQLIRKRVPQEAIGAEGKIIITTLGEKGAEIIAQGQSYHIAPATASQAMDPTGAGDAWRSGFLAGLGRGLDLVTSGRMGAIAAVYAVEQLGTQEHTYTQNDFAERYKQTYGSLLEL